MNILPLVRTLGKVLILPVPKLLFEPISNTITRRIHQLSISGNLTRLQTMNTTCLSAPRALLQPVLPMLNPVCGLKVRGKLELRCRKCYYVARQGRLYVMCKDHPRHKQTQMMKRTYKTWKLTHATQAIATCCLYVDASVKKTSICVGSKYLAAMRNYKFLVFKYLGITRIGINTDISPTSNYSCQEVFESGRTLFVDGDYEYWHYGCDGFNDQGWGCGYRTLQTICSWIIKKKVTDESVPSIRKIQEVLVSLEDKGEFFAGSREWIGSFEVCLVLDHLFNIPSKILHIPRGSDLKNEVTNIEKHFAECASPIMMGGDRDCSSKCIVAINVAAKDTYFLIVDPHFVGKAKYPEQLHESWVKWWSLTDFVDSSFYNLCLPQVKRDISQRMNK